MTKEFNASDEVSVKNAKQKEKNKLDTEQADFKLLMGKQWGRRVVYKILEKSRQYQSNFDNNSNVVYFHEGGRNIGLWLLDKVVSVDKEKFLLMLDENLKQGDSNG